MSIFRFTKNATARWLSLSLFSQRQKRFYRPAAWGTATACSIAALLLATPKIYLDSHKVEDTIVADPATSIAFPKTLKTPSNTNCPPLTLVGVGVRTVSFLRVKVYSVGFYADLDNPVLKISSDMSAEEKLNYLVRNAACTIRIVPTRSTSYNHLRDAFVRALQSRLSSRIKEGTISDEEINSSSASIRMLKGLFPNSVLEKRTPLDIFLSSPRSNKQRVLMFRGLGSIENDWVSTEFVLNYFDRDGPSPPLKDSVFKFMESFSK